MHRCTLPTADTVSLAKSNQKSQTAINVGEQEASRMDPLSQWQEGHKHRQGRHAALQELKEAGS